MLHLAKSHFAGDVAIPFKSLKDHGGFDHADACVQSLQARLARGETAMAAPHANAVRLAGVIEKDVGVLRVKAVRRKSGLVEAGVARTLQQQVGIERQDKGLFPTAAHLI